MSTSLLLSPYLCTSVCLLVFHISIIRCLSLSPFLSLLFTYLTFFSVSLSLVLPLSLSSQSFAFFSLYYSLPLSLTDSSICLFDCVSFCLYLLSFSGSQCVYFSLRLSPFLSLPLCVLSVSPVFEFLFTQTPTHKHTSL